MKTLRITAALLLTLLAAACSGSPTGPSLETAGSSAQMEGGGFFGGGTRMP
jgi:ABC-type glycerol-3-phosphate transport system substrate-binding protein